jgi:peptidoglycan/xylan/chitin deacetylase (PgdA/CDA1 family)/SAM-dependent methyltransferase
MTFLPTHRLFSKMQSQAIRIQRRFKPAAIILMYHRIADEPDDPLRLCVPPGIFARQLEILHKEYEPVPLRELLSRLRAGRSIRRMVALTFDDGYADNLFTAAPLLEKYQIPATVFVTTAYLNGRREFWWDTLARLVMGSQTDPAKWTLTVDGSPFTLLEGETREQVYRRLHLLLRATGIDGIEKVLANLAHKAGIPRMVHPDSRPLTADECTQLARTGFVEIGAHTISHPWLATLPLKEQESELIESRRELERILGFPVVSLAFPYGKRDSVTPDTVQLARNAGYQFACANVRGQVFAATDPFWLPRFIPGVLEGNLFRERIRSFFDYWNPPHQPLTLEETMSQRSNQTETTPPTLKIVREERRSFRNLAGRILRRIGLDPNPSKKKKKKVWRIPVLTSLYARMRFGLGGPPLSVLSGADRGSAIHRYYLERFFEEFAGDIHGHCLEFLNNQYTGRYGKDRVQRLDILHKEGSGTSKNATIIADLLAPHNVPAGTFDCIICTQTLHIVEDPLRFLEELKRLLKPEGVLLLGAPQSSTLQPWWHELWRFTSEGLQFLAARVFGAENIVIRSYGNSIAAAGELRGLCAEDFSKFELDPRDDRFAMEICLRAIHRVPNQPKRIARSGR